MALLKFNDMCVACEVFNHMMKPLFKTAALLLCLFIHAGAALAHSLEVKMLPGEKWWGATDNMRTMVQQKSPAFPFDESSTVNLDFNLAGYSNNNVPFLVSSAGRYIWSDGVVKFSFKSGVITITSDRPVAIESGFGNLRGAFLKASAAHFAPSGLIPPEEFIASPQYNTWIELTYNQNQKDILDYAHAIVDNGFPTGSVLMIDDNWQKYYGNFEFKPERFPDAKAMFDELHALGFKVMLWVCPFISPDSAEFRDLRKRKLLVRNAAGTAPAMIEWWNGFSAAVDMSNPEGRAWFVEKLRAMQKEFGVDGFKFDAGDAQYYRRGEVKVFDGKSYGAAHTSLWCSLTNDFPYNEFRASYKYAGQPAVMRLCDKRYSWEDVANLVPSMIAAAMEGHIYICPDMIGGGEFTTFTNLKAGDFDEELIVRSCQVHAMMPMMQFSVAPWRILSKENLEICRKAAQAHKDLGDYLLRAAREGAKTGEPIVRPMDYAFPGEGFEACTDQYMLGDKYLVAPMLTAGTERTVTLPKGRWVDETGRKFKGGKTYTIAVPLDRIPVFTQD